MTNQQNFKKGDRVRVKSTDIEDIVIDACNGNVFLKNNGYWSAKTLELIEPLDRRTDFLRRLQSLMREFDAEICYCEGDCELYIDLGNGHRFDRIIYPLEYVGYDIGDEGRLNLTADNIMEFDKD